MSTTTTSSSARETRSISHALHGVVYFWSEPRGGGPRSWEMPTDETWYAIAAGAATIFGRAPDGVQVSYDQPGSVLELTMMALMEPEGAVRGVFPDGRRWGAGPAGRATRAIYGAWGTLQRRLRRRGGVARLALEALRVAEHDLALEGG